MFQKQILNDLVTSLSGTQPFFLGRFSNIMYLPFQDLRKDDLKRTIKLDSQVLQPERKVKRSQIGPPRKSDLHTTR
jgi:hypothetical protein